VGYCVACAGFSQRLSSSPFGHGLFCGFSSVPAVDLGHIKRGIGGAHQFVAVIGVVGKIGDAQADGDGARNAGKLKFMDYAT